MDRLGNFENIQLLLEEHDSHMGAAEIHGLAAGMLCVSMEAELDRWLVAIFEAPEDVDSLPNATKQDLFAVFAGTAELLQDDDFTFDLFLPDDDEYISVQAQALSEWCQGFLYGFAYMGVTDGDEWGEESKGVLKDFLEISRIDSENSDDADEQAFIDLHEYVRLGVQMIREERLESAPSDDQEEPAKTLH